MDPQQLSLTLHGETETITGSIQIPRDLRLLDFLNDGSAGDCRNGSTFLELSTVTVIGAGGIREKYPTLYIAKSTIHMVETPDGNSARGIGAHAGHKHHPFVQKTPIRVRLQLPHLIIAGNIHCAAGETVSDIINSGLVFLPLTEAKMNRNGTGHWRLAAFLTVNRKVLVSVQQQEAV